MKLQHSSHPHPLIFNEDQEENNGAGVSCDGCMEPISGPHYRCIITNGCSFFLHKRCAELPQKIKHCLHPEHPLFLPEKWQYILEDPYILEDQYVLVDQYIPELDLCDVCGCLASFLYHCSFCRFNLDVKCAFPPCFSENETQGHHQLNSIIHLSHPHPLILKEEQEEYNDEGGTCFGCGQPPSGPHYRCTSSDFFLHKRCAELPKEIKHLLHPEHPLFLLTKQPKLLEDTSCDVCGEKASFRYRCSVCGFNLDVKCAIPLCFSEIETQGHHQLNSIIHLSHPHPLILKEEQEEGGICFGCGQPTSGPHYRCTSSDFFLHKRCAELPKEIKHLLHPEHPLLLQTKPTFWCCNLCQKNCENFSYHCDSCSFRLDIKCAFPPCFGEGKITPGQHQFVRLLKSIPLKSSSFTCNFCGNDGDESPLLCTLCQLIVHNECASLPETMNIRQHPHLLTYTYFPEEDESGKPHCVVCSIQFNTGHGGYNCKECNFFAHVTCAKEFRATSSEIETRNNEFVDSSRICTASATEMEHFSHEHKLILIEDDGNNTKCAGCLLPIFAPSYGCSPCNFFLHKACVELERKSRMRDTTYSLLSRAETMDGVFRCDLCSQYCNGFVYKEDVQSWSAGRTMFDVRCAVKFFSDSITHESHRDYLYRVDETIVYTCNGCGNHCWLGTFRCASCHFNLDFRCAGLPREAMHRYDEHPLLLTYNDPNDYQFFCDICQKERDPKLWFYKKLSAVVRARNLYHRVLAIDAVLPPASFSVIFTPVIIRFYVLIS